LTRETGTGQQVAHLHDRYVIDDDDDANNIQLFENVLHENVSRGDIIFDPIWGERYQA
jgi:hypothetical protein